MTDHATCLANNFEPRIATPVRVRVMSAHAPDRAFFVVSALLFTVSAAATVIWCNSMSAMEGMPMPGGWTMSMAWMRAAGQTWAATASFLSMWVVMMAAMMLPSLVPMLRRFRQAVGMTDETLRDRLTAVVGLGYFFIWTLFGLAVFPQLQRPR
jgi:predicted metal-binding membrane protein